MRGNTRRRGGGKHVGERGETMERAVGVIEFARMYNSCGFSNMQRVIK